MTTLVLSNLNGSSSFLQTIRKTIKAFILADKKGNYKSLDGFEFR